MVPHDNDDNDDDDWGSRRKWVGVLSSVSKRGIVVSGMYGVYSRGKDALC